ncbi:MAG: putative drug exporter of the superfamily, partial [Streptomyces sp.]|nr:putative drug exporter of the superfamily [Streptomyces sp.]
MDSVLDSLGRTTARHPWLTIGSWLLAIVALLGVGSALGGDFVNDYNVPGTDSQRAVDLATQRFPEVGAASADIVWHTSSGTLRDPAKAAAIKSVVAAFAHQPDVRSASDPLGADSQISQDGRTAIGEVQYSKDLRDLTADATTRLEDAVGPAKSAGVEVYFRGQVVDLSSTTKTSSAELFGLLAALVILLIAFGSLIAAGLPIIVALTGLAAGTAAVLIAGAGLSIPTIAPIVAIMLGLGAGIDYALFVVTRFRDHLAIGLNKYDAAGRALATAGHAVVFAGATVVAAILGLLLTGIPFIGGMGVAAAITVAMTMFSALTLLPAVLGLLGHRVNSVRIGRRRGKAPVPGADISSRSALEDGWWARWATRVAKHRYVFSVLALAVIAVLTVPLFSLHLGAPDDRNSPAGSTQRLAYETVSSSFGPGWNAPLLVVADLPAGAAGNQALTRLRTELTADPEVSTVTPAQLSKTGGSAMLTVVPKHAPQDRKVSALLHRMRDDLVPQAFGQDDKVYVGGTTAYNTDLSDTVGDRLPWMVG